MSKVIKLGNDSPGLNPLEAKVDPVITILGYLYGFKVIRMNNVPRVYCSCF